MPRPHSRLLLSVALACAVLVSACRTFTDPNSQVVAEPRTDGVLVTNRTAQSITYLAFDPNFLASANIVPCYDRCPIVGAGDQTLIPWSSVLGYTSTLRSYQLNWNQVTALMHQSGTVPIQVPANIVLP